MSIKAFKQPASQDPQVTALAIAVTEFATPLVKNPLLGGYLIQNISLTTSPLIIPHILGRPYIGWFVTKIDDDANVFQTTFLHTATSISLEASAAVTVDIWIF